MRSSHLLLILFGVLAGVLVFSLGEDGTETSLDSQQPIEVEAERLQQAPASLPVEFHPDSNRKEVRGPSEVGRKSATGASAKTASDVLEVEVRCFDRGGSDVQPVPKVAFEIRRKPDVNNRGVLFSGTTDAEGTQRIWLNPSQYERAPSGKIRAMIGRVIEPGYQQRFAEILKPLRGTKAYRLRLVAIPGTTIRGQVRDESGKVVRADVALQSWSEKSGVRKLRTVASAKQPRRGSFELHIADGMRGILKAHEIDVGTAVATDVDFDNPPKDLVLVLKGRGVVRGRVTDALGRVAEGLSLLVALAELESDQGPLAFPEPLTSTLALEGRGKSWALPRMNEEGEFEALGLRPGNYVVRGLLPGGRGADRGLTVGFPLLLTGQPVPADGTPLELKFNRPHIVLQFGAPQVLPPGGWRSNRPFVSFAALDGWPSWPTPVVIRCEPSARGERVTGEQLFSWSVGESGYGYDVEEGCSYLVGALGGGFDGTLQKIDVPWGSGRTAVILAAPQSVPLGQVTVGVCVGGTPVRVEHQFVGRSPNGSSTVRFRGVEPEPGVSTSYSLDLHLERLDTGLAVMQLSPGGEHPCTFVVPPGRYVAVASGYPLNPSAAVGDLTPMMRAQSKVLIVAGGKQELQLELEPE